MFRSGWKRNGSDGQASFCFSRTLKIHSPPFFVPTYQLAETSSTDAASDARVAANQNLPGPAFVGQTVLVGVRQRLEDIKVHFMRYKH